jgi:hypothetical protein
MKRKPKKTEAEPQVSLELVGKVNIVERIPGKRIKRTSLDGEIVLHCVLDVLRRGLEAEEKRLSRDPL